MKDSSKSMTVVGHLEELRRRLTISAIAVVVCVIGAFVEKDWVFFLIKRPLLQHNIDTQLITLAPTEPFMTVLKVSIYAGLIIALPILLWQMWSYLMPALYENERKSVIPYVASTTGLFLGGVAFGYLVVLPVGLKFLVGYGGDIFQQTLRADYYVTFVAMFLLAFGVVFEIPLVMMFLAAIDIIDYQRMRKWRKYAVVVMAAAAMVLTPSQDPVSMLLMLGPLVALYEFGIYLARLAAKRRARRQRAEEIALS